MIDSSLGFRDPFLGETNDRKGEEGANGHIYDVTDKRDEVGGALWVVLHNLCEKLLIWKPFPAKTTTKNMTPGSLPKAPSDFGCSGVVSDTSKQSEESCHILGKYLKRAYTTMGAQRA